MKLDELHHYWELLKYGLWGGIVVGLLVGLERQHFAWMQVLYALRYGEGIFTLQGSHLKYTVPDFSGVSHNLVEHDLYFWPLFGWMILGIFASMVVLDFFSNQRPKRRSEQD